MQGPLSQSQSHLHSGAGPVAPKNRTPWKAESHQVEFYSYRADFFANLNRTCRKKTGVERGASLKNFTDIKHLNKFSQQGEMTASCAREFRTPRNSYSYPLEFFVPNIRTCWNSKRTSRKAAFEIIKEIGFFGASINTFLFISKEEGMNESFKH
jgi:hypothetical protein